MSNSILVGAKLNIKRSVLDELNKTITELNTRSEEVLKAIDGAETEEDLNAVEKDAEKIQAELETKMEEKSKLEEEIKALETELDQVSERTPTPVEGERHMQKNSEVREAIKGYVRSKGSVRAGFTSVEGGALIPEELLAPAKTLEDVVDLSKIVKSVKVNNGSGKYPVITKSGSKMVSVAELAANPELSKPTITEVAYDIATYRGYIPVSQEVIDDADYDVTGMIAEEIQDQDLNTKNAAIATVLKSATAKAVTGLDGIKGVFNKDLKKVYNTKAILSSTLFDALDKLKDNTDRYLLQQDITSASGYKLFGKEVIVLDDDVIGDGTTNLNGFIGDPKEFAALFDRNNVSVKWVDNDIYGELLAGFVRFDVKKVDSAAGFYITYTAQV